MTYEIQSPIMYRRLITFVTKYKSTNLLTIIILTAFFLRSYGRAWDEGGHLHPDERMLIMVAGRIQFPDNLYPDFFNYGSLPIYILKGSAQLIDRASGVIPNVATYDGMLYLGRTISSIADVFTGILVYVLAYLLTKRRAPALLATLSYAICVFPIQNAHFFVVDVFMNFFITATISSLIWYSFSRRTLALILIGISMGAAIATKFTSIVFFPGILLSIGIISLNASTHIVNKIISIGIKTLLVSSLTLLVFIICMPYAVYPPSGLLTKNNTSSPIPLGLTDLTHMLEKDYVPQTRFLKDIKEQTRMNNDAYVFPYTLQYVTTKPYLYYLEQITRWGLGIPMSLISFFGFITAIRMLQKKRIRNIWDTYYLPCIIFLMTYGLYFLVVGRSAVKFMRYMLPLYPLLAVATGYGLYSLIKLMRMITKNNKKLLTYALLICAVLTLSVWTYAFMHIYSQKHTRIIATDWILENIPSGSTLAVEHWDDRVPIRFGERYAYQEMTIYDQPDDEKKWDTLLDKLKQSDYVILASNRLYTPLPKLADCTKYKSCYPLATAYYQKLFDGSLGFKKIKEFVAYPKIGNWEIKDDDADESFTVYEHPKIIVFSRQNSPKNIE